MKISQGYNTFSNMYKLILPTESTSSSISNYIFPYLRFINFKKNKASAKWIYKINIDKRPKIKLQKAYVWIIYILGLGIR